MAGMGCGPCVVEDAVRWVVGYHDQFFAIDIFYCVKGFFEIEWCARADA